MSKMWDGRAVYVRHGDLVQTRHPVTVRLNEETAGNVANALRVLNQQCEKAGHRLAADLREVMLALDYVMVGDPASTREHRRMESSKGMDPAESLSPREGDIWVPLEGGPKQKFTNGTWQAESTSPRKEN